MNITITHLSNMGGNPFLIEIEGIIQKGNIVFLKDKMKSKYPPEIVLYDKEIEIPDERLKILYD